MLYVSIGRHFGETMTVCKDPVNRREAPHELSSKTF